MAYKIYRVTEPTEEQIKEFEYGLDPKHFHMSTHTRENEPKKQMVVIGRMDIASNNKVKVVPYTEKSINSLYYYTEMTYDQFLNKFKRYFSVLT